MAKKKKNWQNYTNTSRYIKESATFGGALKNSSASAFLFTPRPRYLRLAIRPATPKMGITATEFAAHVNGTFLPETLFFPDTNFFTKPIDFTVWDALLASAS